MFALGIVAGLASYSAKAAEGCDGPVDVPAVSQDCAAYSATWDVVKWNGGSCPGSTMYTIDYQTCGGSGWKSCGTDEFAIGTSCPCEASVSYLKEAFYYAAYGICASQCPEEDPSQPPCPVECIYAELNPVLWTTCAADTSNQTSIYDFVEDGGKSDTSSCP